MLSKFLTFSILIIYCSLSRLASAEMTIEKLIFDDSKPFHLKILDVVPKEAIIQIGADDSKNTIIEFMDYFCGYCKKMNTELVDDAPYLIPFFQSWDWSAGNQLLAEGFYADIADDYGTAEEAFEATAISYLNGSENWHSWVPADVLEDVLSALAAE